MHTNNTNYNWANVYNKANQTDVQKYLSKDPWKHLVVRTSTH